jgi:sugar lactone lactonase YvrE
MKRSLKPCLLSPFIAVCFLALGLERASAQTYATPYAFTPFAGNPTNSGSGDGTGTGATFYRPGSVATDASGNVYVADTGNNTIRLITPAGVVATLAGSAGNTGSANGSASTASFNGPIGVAVDGSGNIYVADTGNNLIRKISGSTVSTLAGSGSLGHADGTGSGASFANPAGIAVDASGNVYVADEGSDEIREITPGGVVSTIAGKAQTPGFANGTGTNAQFNHPEGVAVDASGNVYVADTQNSLIREITPTVSGGVTTWTVSTLAGQTGTIGFADGTGTAAQFNLPIGVCVDADTPVNVYVADTVNCTIRRIASGGVVTTLAGEPEVVGTSNATGAAALFGYPWGVTVDRSGNMYVADTENETIRKGVSAALTIGTQPVSQTGIPGGVVTFSVGATSPTTISYQWKFNGTAIPGATASSYTISPVQASNQGSYTVTLTNTSGGSVTSAAATLTVLSVTQPTISTPAAQVVNAGATVTFTVTATGGDLTYQWYFNGTSIPGTNSATLTLPNVGTSQAGYYAASALNPAGSAISGNAGLTVNYAARLTNLSARANVGTGSGILIAGLGIGGTGSKQALLRGDGPALPSVGVPSGYLTAAQMALYDSGAAPESAPQVMATNGGWSTAPVKGASDISFTLASATAPLMASLGAFSLTTGSLDAALVATLPAGPYTAQISGAGSATGIALAEIYDADPGTSPSRLTNISARASVGTGGNILIGGFVIAGTTSETVLIRGIGPSLALAPFNLAGTLAAPQLVLYDSVVPTSPKVIATDTAWGTAPVVGTSTVQAGVLPATASVMSTVGAFSIAAGSADSAMIVTLPPGAYTVQLSGVGGTSGIALVEIYEVP